MRAQDGQGVQGTGAVHRPLAIERRTVEPVGQFRNAGVGHHETYRAEVRSLIGQSGKVGGLSDIAGLPDQLLRIPLKQFGQCAEFSRHGQHACALIQQAFGSSQAYARTGTGDDGKLALKNMIHVRLPFLVFSQMATGSQSIFGPCRTAFNIKGYAGLIVIMTLVESSQSDCL